jgi:hypothetical protein
LGFGNGYKRNEGKNAIQSFDHGPLKTAELVPPDFKGTAKNHSKKSLTGEKIDQIL